jgi:hypothetical protein
MHNNKGVFLILCCFLLLLVSINLASLWSTIGLEERVLHAEKRYFEKQKHLAISFKAWQAQVRAKPNFYKQSLHEKAGQHEESCSTEEINLKCGIILVRHDTALIYLDSVYGREQSLLYFAKQ